jgi:2-polyprenyl-6-methoxyphenol hydroxylase-like FAD-dependent oxidoreductase
MGSIDNETPQLVYPMPLAPERGAAITSNGNPTADITTPILIVGGGPVGMLQALMLARIHKQECVLIEKEPTTTTFPKMEYTNGRSMEMYRKMGLHDSIRSMATKYIPEDLPNDELILTSLLPGGRTVHSWDRLGAAAQRKESKANNDGVRYLEPHMRCHQIHIEKWLQEQVQQEPLIRSHWGHGFVALEETDDGVTSEVKKSPDGELVRIQSKYVIGCDGGGSWVRKSASLESKRNFL